MDCESLPDLLESESGRLSCQPEPLSLSGKLLQKLWGKGKRAGFPLLIWCYVLVADPYALKPIERVPMYWHPFWQLGRSPLLGSFFDRGLLGGESARVPLSWTGTS